MPPSLAPRRAARLFVAAAGLAILVATLAPAGTELAPGWDTVIVGGDDALADVVQNVLLFLPLGAALGLLGMRTLRLVALGALLSFAVEFAQQWIPGRDPSFGDICFNTLGTALGGLLAYTAPRWLTPPRRRAAWQSLGAAVGVVGVWFTTAWLFQAAPPATPYVADLRPDLPHLGLYPGRVLTAALGPLPLAAGSHLDAAHAPLATGTVLRVVAVAGRTPPGRLAPLLAITDERGKWVVLLSIDRRDLSLWFRTHSTDWRTDRPELRARGALAAIAPGDTFAAAAWREHGAYCLALDSLRWCNRAYTLADGWRLIFDLEHGSRLLLGLLGAGWLGGLLVPIGWWARRHWGSAAALVVAGGSLFAVPALTGLGPTPLPALIGALAGLALGAALRLLLR
ncbi:MAG TPA: VanZ family protein [Gemmatimonadales bacterium]